MCTVTIVPCDDGGFRLACNRDERRTRPDAVEPRLHRLNRHVAVFPTDPFGGGTWIAVNDAGLAMTILNRHAHSNANGQTVASDRDRLSRGVIIPALLDCGLLDDVLEVARTLPPARFEPFRLVAIQDARVGVMTHDGRSLVVEVSKLSRPLFFTSSSLGDALVEESRGRLFAELVLNDKSAWLRAQFHFHRSQWPGRPDLSVVMERSDAATVSRTVVDVGRDDIHVGYELLTGLDAAAVTVT